MNKVPFIFFLTTQSIHCNAFNVQSLLERQQSLRIQGTRHDQVVFEGDGNAPGDTLDTESNTWFSWSPRNSLYTPCGTPGPMDG